MPLPFSILIPTFNRLEKLRVVLEALEQQPRIAEGEVIVGIDGSIDGTKEFLAAYCCHSDLPRLKESRNPGSLQKVLSFFSIPNSGRAVIRNRLIEKATGDLLIFIQDDIVVSPGWLETHLQAHGQHVGAVVGHITWYPQMPITPYMLWLEHGGPLLNYSGLSEGDETDFWHFYMGNISMPCQLIGELRFDESLKSYGWEDIVFGYQFLKRGNKMVYSKKALAWHNDEYREEDLPKYASTLVASARIVQEKYPDMGITPPWWKRAIFRVMIVLGSLVWPLLPQSWKWYLTMKQEFLKAL